MRNWATWAVLLCSGWGGLAETHADPEALLARVKARMNENLARVPDYVCVQTVERFSRTAPDAEWKRVDTLRLQVGFAGGKEIFAWHGARQFEEKQLSEMVGAGTVGTGSFAIHATNVFLSDAPEFTFRGEDSFDGKPAYRFDYAVSEDLSRYKIRVSPFQAFVAFHGSFWVDHETLDLLRLEVRAEDIPPELELARSSDIMEYRWTRFGRSEFLLPKSSELTMVGARGVENRNRTELSGCRQYVGESSLNFEGEPRVAEVADVTLPSGLTLYLQLDSEIDPASAALGDPVRAVLYRPLLDGERLLAPQGAVVHARLVRLEAQSTPIDHFVVGIELESIELADSRAELYATMADAGPASGLIREARRLMPTFTRSRSPRLQVLVRERQRGQGVFLWKAKEKRIPRGFRMRWQTE